MEAGVTMASLPLTLCGVPMFQVSPRVHVAMWRGGVDMMCKLHLNVQSVANQEFS